VGALRNLVPDVVERDVFICGPEAWADAVRDSAVAAGVPEASIHLEKFSW
jgi:ferredoxin-NADP reductase